MAREFITLAEAQEELNLDGAKLERKVNDANYTFHEFLDPDVDTSNPIITSACMDYVEYLYNKKIGVKEEADIDVRTEYFASTGGKIPVDIYDRISGYKKKDPEPESEDSNYGFQFL